MTGGLNFWDHEIWSFIITISILFGGMLLAVTLTRKLGFLRRSMLPSSVLGGFLVLFAARIYEAVTGTELLNHTILETLTYHGLGLGFIALAWRHMDGIKGGRMRRDVFRTATVTVGGYLLQGVVGLGITILLHFLIGNFAGAGVLLPMGYGQGPGQAFNWGTQYETTYGFLHGKDFGLAVSAMGFISASIGGVLFLNKRSVKEKYQIAGGTVREEMALSDYVKENEVPVSETMDKISIQFGIVLMTYAVAYLSMWLIYRFILLPAGGFAMKTINPLIWGFNFLIGTAWAILFRAIGDLLRKKGIMHRVYTNDFMLNRISGLMFDVMVVASIASIDLKAFEHAEFILPLILVSAIGMIATYIYTQKTCRRLFPGYCNEAFLAQYGMLTGTASTGVILLREIDPLFKTPASHNLIYQNMWAILLGAPMLLMLGIIPQSITHALICFGVILLLFGVILFMQYRAALRVRREEGTDA